MIQIALERIPNQSFSIRLDSRFYNITLKSTNGVMAATVVRDDVIIEEGMRLVGGGLMLPYKYQENGNFLLTTMNDELPDYLQFGITQFLIYASPAELEVLRGGT